EPGRGGGQGAGHLSAGKTEWRGGMPGVRGGRDSALRRGARGSADELLRRRLNGERFIMNAIRFLATNHPFVAADVRRRIRLKVESIRLVTSAATVQARNAQIVFRGILSLILVLGFVSSGC